MTRGLRFDVAIAILLALAVGTWSYQRSGLLHPVLYQYQSGALETHDIWFDADIPKMSCLMTDRIAGQHAVTSEHPLISLLTFVPFQAIRVTTGAGKITSLRVLVALLAGAWIAMLFATLRALGRPRVDAALFALLASASAAAVFWTAVPEAFLIGAITLLAPVWLVARQPDRPVRDATFALVSAVSLSATVTNWISGLAATATAVPYRRALQISANALMIVSLLWFLQSWIFPENVYFLGSGRALELLNEERWPAPLEVMRVLLAHAMVMPNIGSMREPAWRALTVQGSATSIATPGGAVLMVWLTVLAIGALHLARNRSARSVGIVLGAAMAVQVVVHFVVGKESFLYVMHTMTLLIVAASFAAAGRGRVPVLAAVTAIAVTAGAINARQFDTAATMVEEIGREAAATGAVFEMAGECAS